MDKYSNIDLQKMRLYNNGLIKKFKDEEICIESLIGIQCQYLTYAMISIYLRTQNKYNIFYNNKLIKSWGQRTTLHIYHKKDYNLISDLYREKNNWVYKYAMKLGINYKDYLNALSSFLQTNKTLVNKDEIQDIIPKYKSKEIMEWSGLLILATYHKILYGILNKEDKKIYIKNDIKENGKTIQNLIHRYFKFFGPASKQDFLHWSGLKYNNIKDFLDEYLSNSKYFNIDNVKYYYVSLPKIKKIDFGYPIILGKFDPLLISYKEKNWILDGKDKSLIWKIAGQIEGVILTENGLSGTWHYKLEKDKVVFEILEIEFFSHELKNQLYFKFAKIGKQIFERESLIIYKGGKL